jgi:CBS domain-containing protein/gamma-glutamyl:cysteine ligase YbdK (ATP-grasp superfamily)
MGEHDIDLQQDERRVRAYMKALLNDLRALQYMLENNLIESGVRRIGAEQEMFLVDGNLRPAPAAQEVLKRVGDARLTTEIARFNLEANLTPLDLRGRCLRQMENELLEVIALTREGARAIGTDVLLAGILPTLQMSDLTLENITPNPRYYELNRTLTQLRGGEFSIHIKGLDELYTTHDNVMMESCNTSFQIHLQVAPAEFASLYNMAQAVTAPVLAAAVNSPLLFGHRLWQETRLALFQHSTDARSRSLQARSYPPRVGFGERWLKDSVMELFREQIARYRVIFTKEPDEDAMAVLEAGGVPRLSALRLHNGTVWPWNRACYGVVDGRAHLRIENRAFPSGPTVLDEMANAAFFIGLMTALPAEYGQINKLMTFDDAKANFFAAARHGLQAQLTWTKGNNFSASELILKHLLPLARQGLRETAIEAEDIDRYLGTIEERVKSGQTGAQWMLRSLTPMTGEGTPDMRHRTLAAALLERQQTNEPVHRWPVIESGNGYRDWRRSYQTVGQFMSTDLFTVRPDDLVDLAASMMDWKHVRHIPVEDDAGRLVGLVSHRNLLRLLSLGAHEESKEPVAVRSIMKPAPVTVAPEMPTLDAIEVMRRHNVGCLPVVKDEHLVGIVTAHDFLAVSARLFEEQLRN